MNQYGNLRVIVMYKCFKKNAINVNLLPLVLFFLLTSCSDQISNDESLDIVDSILDFEVPIINPVEFWRHDTITKSKYDVFFPKYNVFDSFTNSRSLSFHEMNISNLVVRSCLYLDLNSEKILKEFEKEKEVLDRVEKYLEGNSRQYLLMINYSSLSLSRFGVEVLSIEDKCSKNHGHGYVFSRLYANVKNNRGVIYAYHHGHQEQYSVFYLNKLGDKWYLLTKEIL